MKKDNTSRPIIFICSPFAGNIKSNIKKARIYCAFALTRGVIPFAPHLLFPQFMDEGVSAERELGISFGLAMLEKCDGLWAFGGTVSKGMRVEIEKACEYGLMIKYFDSNFVEVSPFA